MKAFTDYPFPFLGDVEGEEAPIRSCIVVAYDGDKYCDIIVEGSLEQIKSGYIYKVAGRCGDVPNFSRKELELLPTI